jgi:replicative DNA helicase
MTTRTFPSSIEAEQALLGACFLNPTIIPQVRAVIQPEDFYMESHGLIFEAICALGERTEAISVAEWLQARGFLEEVGGHAKIVEVSDFVSTSAGWPYHAGVLRDKATRRAIIKACARAAEAAYGTDEPEEILSGLKEDIRHLNTDTDKPYRDNLELVTAVWNDIERRAECGEQLVGVPTGFRGIDEKVFGLELKTTIYLAARPSVGKTSLALNISEKRWHSRSLFFSLESNAEAITRRRMAARSKVFLWRIRTATWKMANTSPHGRRIPLRKPSDRVRSLPLNIENLTAQCESMAMDRPPISPDRGRPHSADAEQEEISEPAWSCPGSPKSFQPLPRT